MTSSSELDRSSPIKNDEYTTASDLAVTGRIYADSEGFALEDLSSMVVWMSDIGTHDGRARLTYGTGVGRRYAVSLLVFRRPRLESAGHEVNPDDLDVLLDRAAPHAEAVNWIKDAMGLPLERVGKLLGVSRQTVDAWRKQERISDPKRQRLLAVRDVLERARRLYRTPEELAAWLDTPRGADARTPAQLLEAGEIDRARLLAVAAPSPNLSRPPAWASRPVPEVFQDAMEQLPSSLDALPPDEEEVPFDRRQGCVAR